MKTMNETDDHQHTHTHTHSTSVTGNMLSTSMAEPVVRPESGLLVITNDAPGPTRKKQTERRHVAQLSG